MHARTGRNINGRERRKKTVTTAIRAVSNMLLRLFGCTQTRRHVHVRVTRQRNAALRSQERTKNACRQFRLCVFLFSLLPSSIAVRVFMLAAYKYEIARKCASASKMSKHESKYQLPHSRTRDVDDATGDEKIE